MRKLLFNLFLTASILACSSLSYASSVDAVLKMMMKKGMITQADYDEGHFETLVVGAVRGQITF